MCINLNHLEAVWPEVEVSWLSYGCCWGSSWTLSEIPALFPCLSRTVREISYRSHRISPATDVSSWCFVGLGYTFAEEETALPYSSDENPTLGKVVFFNFIQKLNIWRSIQNTFLCVILGLCSCFNSMLVQADWAFPRSMEMAWKTL